MSALLDDLACDPGDGWDCAHCGQQAATHRYCPVLAWRPIHPPEAT